MGNTLKKYKKEGLVIIDKGNRTLDTPTFEIIDVHLDPIDSIVTVEILHKVMQGNVEQPHSSFEKIDSKKVITSKKLDLDALEKEILKLPQYSGATEV